MDKKNRYDAIGKCLDRYVKLTGNLDVVTNRFDRFIDLDLCGVDVIALSLADDMTLVHDVGGIVSNLDRGMDDNGRAVARLANGFVPRTRMAEEV